MNQTQLPWQIFENLVRRILEKQGFVVRIHGPRGNLGFDFVGERNDEAWAIEVKFYKTARAQPVLLEAAAARLVANGVNAESKRGMLIVSCVLPAALRKSLQERFNITLVDRLDLRDWAAASPDLASELDAVSEVDPSAQLDVLAVRPSPSLSARILDLKTAPPEDKEGRELCEELRSLKRGRSGWVAYEKVCAKILTYLFPNDLHGWHKQLRTDDGLNRYDFVCRVKPTTDFWKFLIEHLGSRYILFEFKNYAKKITQDQILTTEKYLLENGLRKVAIIFTRIGSAPSGLRMAKGAMRESGKLMLVVDDDLVCKMLHMKERGEDPTDCLFELADDFLLKLSR